MLRFRSARSCSRARPPLLAALALCLLLLAGPVRAGTSYSLDLNPANDVLYQVSTVAKLKDGYWKAETTVGEIKQRGDFGIGTFTGLDGEMFFHGGRVWQIPVSGEARLVPDGLGVPFAQVTHFEPDYEIKLKYVTDYEDFKRRLRKELPGPDMLYAVHIRADFQYLQTRSVPASAEPYPGLAEVVARQAVFTFKNVTGDMVGWHTPDYMTGVGAPGLHLHFLDVSEKRGGHVLDFSAAEVVVELDVTPKMEIVLPKNTAF